LKQIYENYSQNFKVKTDKRSINDNDISNANSDNKIETKSNEQVDYLESGEVERWRNMH
jgi:hypothetical protein